MSPDILGSSGTTNPKYLLLSNVPTTVLLALFTIFIISPSALLSPIPFLLILAITLSLWHGAVQTPEGMNISFMFSSSGIKNP